MGIITDVKFQKKNHARVSVFVDGEFFCGMQSITAAKEGIKPGAEIDEAWLLQAIAESESAEAFDKALSYLSKAPRTKKEIENSLYKKEYPSFAVNATIQKLTDYGYLDDERYVDGYLSFYSGDRGVKRLKVDLMQKGVDKNLLEEKLSALPRQEDAARLAAKKYLRTHRDADKNKLRAHLYSKGFEYSVISDVVGEDDYD